MTSPGCGNDNALGPIVSGCRDDFDFTLKFEQLFLSILPSVVFLLAVIFRVFSLRRRLVIIDGPSFRAVKLVSKFIDGDPRMNTC